MRQDRHLTTANPRLLRQLLPNGRSRVHAGDRGCDADALNASLCARFDRRGANPGPLPPLSDGRVEASAGIEATVGGRRYRLGKLEFALVDKQSTQRADVAAIAAREGLHAASTIVLADADGPVALFVFGERLRDDAAVLIDTAAERGVEPVLISGDRRAPVHAVAASLGIERGAHASNAAQQVRVGRGPATRRSQGRNGR